MNKKISLFKLMNIFQDQFEFVFVAVAEEVTYLLKALPQ
jgi:hypothetical protein